LNVSVEYHLPTYFLCIAAIRSSPVFISRANADAASSNDTHDKIIILIMPPFLRMVVDHSPAFFCFRPNRCEPTLAVRLAGARQYELSGHERVVLSQHSNDEVLITQLLKRSPRFPEP